MTCPETRSRRRWRGSWAAAASLAALLTSACGSTPSAAASPSPTATVSPSASAAPSPSGDETPVATQLLPPAPDLPVANLCAKPVVISADGNALPLTCSNGDLNVRAWQYYASISASVLGLGLNPTQGQAESAICDDLNHNHATRAEESNGYRLARLYYGWTFDIDVTKLTCQ
jgi:hypothetical protein